MRLSTIMLFAAAFATAGCGAQEDSGNADPAANIESGPAEGGGDGPGNTREPAAATGNHSGAAPAPAAPAPTPGTPAAGAVSFRGCPILREVEGGCLIVESGGTTYDINSARPRPDPARRQVIEGSGIPGGASICMTGTVLSDIEWRYTDTKCAGAQD